METSWIPKGLIQTPQPVSFAGMIPVNLLGYDERSRWTEYVGTLPYTKTQIVSAKYLIGLFTQIALLTVICIAQGVKMGIEGTFVLKEFLLLMMLLLIMASVASSLTLPFVFKYGVEKGRGAYYVMIGVVCAGSIIATTIFKEGLQNEIQLNAVLPIACLVGTFVLACNLNNAYTVILPTTVPALITQNITQPSVVDGI